MSEFENSTEAKVAKKIFQARQTAMDKAKEFLNRAKVLQGKAIDAYTATAIEMVGSRRKMMRGIKETLKNFATSLKLKAEDKVYEAGEALKNTKTKGKGLWGRITKSLTSAKDTAHYGLLVAKEKVGKFMTDKIDTAHYGALVAGDKVKPVAKAVAHGMALAAGATIGGAVLAGKAAYEFGKDTSQRINEDFKEFGSDVKALGGAMKEMAQEKVGAVKDGLQAGWDKAAAKGREFVAGAKVLQGKALNAYTATAIEMVGGTRKAVHGVKEAIGNFKTQAQLKFEDKAYDAGKAVGKAVKSGKALWGRITKSLTSAKDTAHYGVLVAGDKVGKFITDKVDTAHYGALVVEDKVKPVAKAALHGSAMLAGATIGGAVKVGKEVGAAAQELGGAVKTVAKGIGAQMKEDAQALRGAVKGSYTNTTKAISGVGKTVKAVSKEKADSFMKTAGSVVKGGRNLAGSLMKSLRSNTDKALSTVGNTLSAAKGSINKGMEQVRAGVEKQARGSTMSWFRMGKMNAAARS